MCLDASDYIRHIKATDSPKYIVGIGTFLCSIINMDIYLLSLHATVFKDKLYNSQKAMCVSIHMVEQGNFCLLHLVYLLSCCRLSQLTTL